MSLYGDKQLNREGYRVVRPQNRLSVSFLDKQRPYRIRRELQSPATPSAVAPSWCVPNGLRRGRFTAKEAERRPSRCDDASRALGTVGATEDRVIEGVPSPPKATAWRLKQERKRRRGDGNVEGGARPTPSPADDSGDGGKERGWVDGWRDLSLHLQIKKVVGGLCGV